MNFVFLCIFCIVTQFPLIFEAKSIRSKPNKDFVAKCNSDEAITSISLQKIPQDIRLIIVCRKIMTEEQKRRKKTIEKSRFTHFVNVQGEADAYDLFKMCQGGEFLGGLDGIYRNGKRLIRFECRTLPQVKIVEVLCQWKSVGISSTFSSLKNHMMRPFSKGYPQRCLGAVLFSSLGVMGRFCFYEIPGVTYSQEYQSMKTRDGNKCINNCCKCDCDQTCKMKCETDDGCEPMKIKKKYFDDVQCGLPCLLRCGSWKQGIIFGKSSSKCKSRNKGFKKSCYCEFDALSGKAGEGRCDQEIVESKTLEKQEQSGDSQNIVNNNHKQFLKSTPLEVVFVVDESLSVGQSNYDKSKEFLADLVQTFPVDDGTARVAVIRYSGIPNYGINIEFKLDTKQTMASVITAIKNMEFAAGRTATGEALRVANLEVLSEARSGAQKLVIVITDGISNDGISPGIAANELKRSGSTVMAIGVGYDVSTDELKEIASDPSLVFAVASYEGLDAESNMVASAIQQNVATKALKRHNGKCGTGCISEEIRYFLTGSCTNSQSCKEKCDNFLPGVKYGYTAFWQCRPALCSTNGQSADENYEKDLGAIHPEPDDCLRSTDEKWFGAGYCQKAGQCQAKCQRHLPPKAELKDFNCEDRKSDRKIKCHCVYEVAFGENCNRKECYCEYHNPDEPCDDNVGSGLANDNGFSDEVDEKEYDMKHDDSKQWMKLADKEDREDEEETNDEKTKEEEVDLDVTLIITLEACFKDQWFGEAECSKLNDLTDCAEKCNKYVPGLRIGPPKIIECAEFKEGQKPKCHCFYESEYCRETVSDRKKRQVSRTTEEEIDNRLICLNDQCDCNCDCKD